MLKILLLGSLFTIAGANPSFVEVTPNLSNGHLSVLTFKQQVETCTFNRETNLSFFYVGGRQQALVSLPHAYDQAIVTLYCRNGTNELTADLPVAQAEYEERNLKVDSVYTDKKSPELKARIKKESSLMNNALAEQSAERFWEGHFSIPRNDKVTSPFGARRLYNGVQKSVHFGLDIDGEMGDPIYAMAAGRVALAAENFFYPGSVVIIDHGQGLQSLYMHMSQQAVKTGDMVKKGQLLGLVGKSGRVTGPHLHWGTKLYGNYFYPFDLFREDIKSLLE